MRESRDPGGPQANSPLGGRMLRPAVMVPFILGSILAAWLRFDAGSMMLSWIVMLICIAVTLASSGRETQHPPQLTLPPECEALKQQRSAHSQRGGDIH